MTFISSFLDLALSAPGIPFEHLGICSQFTNDLTPRNAENWVLRNRSELPKSSQDISVSSQSFPISSFGSLGSCAS